MNIRKVKLVSLAIFAVGLVSCAGKTQQPQADVSLPNETILPCQVFDDDDWFQARGIASGSRHQIDAVTRLALTYAQDRIRQNMTHAFEGMVSPFLDGIGTNQGTDIGRNTSIAGNQIIEITVNDTYVTCERHSGVDERGHIEAYVAVRISKKDSFNKLAKMVEDMVSEDEAMGIRFREQNFREAMEKKFKEFKQNN